MTGRAGGRGCRPNVAPGSCRGVRRGCCCCSRCCCSRSVRAPLTPDLARCEGWVRRESPPPPERGCLCAPAASAARGSRVPCCSPGASRRDWRSAPLSADAGAPLSPHLTSPQRVFRRRGRRGRASPLRRRAQAARAGVAAVDAHTKDGLDVSQGRSVGRSVRRVSNGLASTVCAARRAVSGAASQGFFDVLTRRCCCTGVCEHGIRSIGPLVLTGSSASCEAYT